MNYWLDDGLHLCVTSFANITASIARIRDQNGLRAVFLAAPNHERGGVKRALNAVSLTDIPNISRWLNREHMNSPFWISLLEQIICHEATLFTGTHGSTWTDTVEMLRDRDGRPTAQRFGDQPCNVTNHNHSW